MFAGRLDTVFICSPLHRHRSSPTRTRTGQAARIRAVLLWDSASSSAIHWSPGHPNAKPPSHDQVPKPNTAASPMLLRSAVGFASFFMSFTFLRTRRASSTATTYRRSILQRTLCTIDEPNMWSSIYTSCGRRLHSGNYGCFMFLLSTNSLTL
jgi:hypothetical protein